MTINISLQSKSIHKSYLKLHEEESGTTPEQKTNAKPYPHLESLKEFDLLLLSSKKLETDNAKQLTSSKFLLDMKNKVSLEKGQIMMMAIVNEKKQKQKMYIEIKVDIQHESSLVGKCT